MPTVPNASKSSNANEKLDAFTIVEREGAKPIWVRVGAAFENKDGSLNVYLDALPINGKLQLRRPYRNERRNDNVDRE